MVHLVVVGGPLGLQLGFLLAPGSVLGLVGRLLAGGAGAAGPALAPAPGARPGPRGGPGPGTRPGPGSRPGPTARSRPFGREREREFLKDCLRFALRSTF